MKIEYNVGYTIKRVTSYDGEDIKNLTHRFKHMHGDNVRVEELEHYYERELVEAINRAIENKLLMPGQVQSVSVMIEGIRYVAIVDVWVM